MRAQPALTICVKEFAILREFGKRGRIRKLRRLPRALRITRYAADSHESDRPMCFACSLDGNGSLRARTFGVRLYCAQCPALLEQHTCNIGDPTQILRYVDDGATTKKICIRCKHEFSGPFRTCAKCLKRCRQPPKHQIRRK